MGSAPYVETGGSTQWSPKSAQKRVNSAVARSALAAVANAVASRGRLLLLAAAALVVCLSLPRHGMASLSMLRSQRVAHLDELVLCTLVQNEHEHLRQWALFHLSVGFTKLIIYDHLSSPPLSDPSAGLAGLAPYVEIRRMTAARSSEPNGVSYAQLQAFTDCYHSFADAHAHDRQQAVRKASGSSGDDAHVEERAPPRAVAVSFTDIDEYLYPCDAASATGTAGGGGGGGGSGAALRRIVEQQTSSATPGLALRCGKFGPGWQAPANASDSASATRVRVKPGKLLIETNRYRAPAGDHYGFWEGQAASWLQPWFAGCTDPGSARGVACESQTLNKYLYTLPLMPRDVDRVGVHGPLNGAGGEREDLAFAPSRPAGLCCNHYFMRSVQDAVAKAARNNNPEYLRRAVDANVLAWFSLVRDEGIQPFVAPARRLLELDTDEEVVSAIAQLQAEAGL